MQARGFSYHLEILAVAVYVLRIDLTADFVLAWARKRLSDELSFQESITADRRASGLPAAEPND